MKGFVFRLQKVLDHRMRVEDEKKLSFVESRINFLKEAKKLDELKKELDDCSSKPITSFSTPLQYIMIFNYISLLDERIEEQSKVVKARKDEMDIKKAQFEGSRKDRKVIDKLKENAHREYNIFMDNLEQKQNDEFALYGYTRK